MAACIDFVARCSSNEVVLFDWKRTKKLCNKYTNNWSNMEYPVNHLPDVAGTHYRLQLNLYKHIIEKHYDLRVKTLRVVCFHPDNESSFFIDKVPSMRSEVHAILQAHLSDWQEVVGGASQDSMTACINEELGDLDSEGRADIARDVAGQAEEAQQEEADRSELLRDLSQDLEAHLQLVDREAAAQDNILAQARKRRRLEGASTTLSRFERDFADLRQEATASLSAMVALRIPEEISIPQKVAKIRDQVLRFLRWVKISCGFPSGPFLYTE